mmetsp:Transcript_14133/g.42658  ORF Transcript_14133/g.42658 Transcript_14133/m.42658 type:complete len:290 (+) Transcript_14133:354-1223(+)
MRVVGGLQRWLLIGAALLSAASQATALSWRIYAGWDECVTARLPDAQWDLVLQSLRASGTNESQLHTVPAAVVVEAGVLVADEYGSDAYRGTVDITVQDPTGKEIHSKTNVQDDEIEVDAHGLQGPWKLCFKVHRGGTYRPPSLLVELSYFVVNHRSLVGTSYEWDKSTQHPLPPDAHLEHPAAALAHHADKEHMATAEQVEEVMEGLSVLEVHLQGLEHEQHHLQQRATRHLKTVKSTHKRTLVYYMAIYAAIIATSFLQVVGVRLMFKGERGGGRLPVSLGRPTYAP